MVVLSLYAMIIITGFFHSIIVQGLDCYQCEHPGSLYLNVPCKSAPCDNDPYHKSIKKRFNKVISDVNPDITDPSLVRIEEHCYIKITRPIPFNGHYRGCYISLNYANNSETPDKLLEPQRNNPYEKFVLCDGDNCNDLELPFSKSKMTAEMVLKQVQDKIDGKEDGSTMIRLDKLCYLPTMLVIIAINYLPYCDYFG